LPDGDKICLQPGSAVIIETIESVQFPKSRFGHIVPKVSLLQNGLSNTSKIDPGYNGHLLITVLIWVKEQFISIKVLHTLCASYQVIPYQKGSQRIAGNSRAGFLSKLRDFIETNQTLLLYFLLLQPFL